MISKKLKNKQTKRITVASMVLLLLWVGLFSVAMTAMVPQEASALRVTLKRIVFEGPRRAETIMITNNKAKEQIYRLGWKQMRMTDKALLSVDDADDYGDLKTASDMVRYAPRRIILPPGGSQQVRLMLRRPRDLEVGEYRSHFWIVPEASATEFSVEERAAAVNAPVAKLTMLAGITLPVFVRHGRLTVSGSLTDLTAERSSEGIAVGVTVLREGNRSLYGDFEISCAGGDGAVLRLLRGFAVYEETPKRRFKLEVKNSDHAGVAGCGKLNVRYISDKTDNLFKGELVAEASVSVR